MRTTIKGDYGLGYFEDGKKIGEVYRESPEGGALAIQRFVFPTRHSRESENDEQNDSFIRNGLISSPVPASAS